MKREVVQDFLNLPGIAGVALIDGRSRPYFFGMDTTLNFRQKEALAQGIQQVIETTPSDFKFFEFQFIRHQIYIYKLEHSITLLVLTREGLVYSTFVQAIEQIKVELQGDFASAIATFRLLAGTSTTQPLNPGISTSENRIAAAPVRPVPVEAVPATPKLDSIDPASPDPIALKEALTALNHISEFTRQYLGAIVVANTWKSSRPSIEWLQQFAIDRSGKITLAETASDAAQTLISSEQQQWLQQWTAAFTKRCSIVLKDFPILLQHVVLDDRSKAILLPPTPQRNA